MVRSHLEYATTVWNPHHEGLIKSRPIEKVQMRATKLVTTIKHLPYAGKIKTTAIAYSKISQIQGDRIEVYKIFRGSYMTLI